MGAAPLLATNGASARLARVPAMMLADRLVCCAHLWHDDQQSSWRASGLTAAVGA
jgi:hypothetical protein